MTRLVKRWTDKTVYRRGEAAQRLLSLLPHDPVTTVKRIAALLEISIPQANHAVAKLQRDSILFERTGYSRNWIFVAEGTLSILNRLFGSIAD